MLGLPKEQLLVDKGYIAAADVGGSHITVGLVKPGECTLRDGYVERIKVDSKGTQKAILRSWFKTFERIYAKFDMQPDCIAFGMPGPFDYTDGISLINGVDKYESLYGLDIRQAFAERFGIAMENIRFRNDAEAFLHGEVLAAGYGHEDRILGFTLGTGFGSAFSHSGKTRDMNVGLERYKDGIVDDYLTTRWFHRVGKRLGIADSSVPEVSRLAMEGDEKAIGIFEEFCFNLTAVVSRKVVELEASHVILGGNIAKAHALFLPDMRSMMRAHGINPSFQLAQLGEQATLLGAASLFFTIQHTAKKLDI